MSQFASFDRFDLSGNQITEEFSEEDRMTFAPKFKPLEAETDVPEFSLASQELFQETKYQMNSQQMKLDLKRKYSQGVKITFLRYMNERIAEIQKRRTLSL